MLQHTHFIAERIKFDAQRKKSSVSGKEIPALTGT